jgi:hypothetical protein
MKLAHSIPTVLFVSLAALASACSDDATGDAGTGGTSGTATGGTGTGGTATGGTSGSGTGGSAGSGTGGTAGAGTGGSATGGSAGAATGGSSGSGAADYPSDSSQAGIEAWLAMNTYTMMGMGFRPESMPSDGMTAPHMLNKRYFNETIITSNAAGNMTSTHTTGSMAVKDILTGTSVIGKAAMLKTATGWVFYCKASEADRCYSGSTADATYYGTTGGTTGCACHSGGIIVSRMDIPAP